MDWRSVGEFVQTDTPSGARVFVLPTKKFKQVVVRLMRSASLEDDAAGRALLPAVLWRGTRRLATMRKIAAELEGLWGTTLSYDVGKRADQQDVCWNLVITSPDRVVGGERLLDDVVSLLDEVLHDPCREGGRLREDVLEQEKVNQVHYIEALRDDKHNWAMIRAAEETFRGEAYALNEWGTVEAVRALDPTSLEPRLDECLPTDVVIVGDIEPDAILERVLQLSETGPLPVMPVSGHRSISEAKEIETVVEEDDISQAKLVIGCRIDTSALDDRAYDALMMMNDLLGGGMYSRLFKEVREKRGLAYYAGSSLDCLQGAAFLSCGIDASHFEEARDLCLAQIQALAHGRIDEDAFASSKRTLELSVRQAGDSPGALSNFLLLALAAGRIRTIEEVRRSFACLTKDEVVRAARRVRPQTVYLLRGGHSS